MRKISSLLALLCLLFLTSCSKEKVDITPAQYPYFDVTPGQYPYFFTATIAGKPVKYEANDLNERYRNGATASSTSALDDYNLYEGTYFTDGQSSSINSIAVLVLQHFKEEPSAAGRAAMFRTGNYGYGQSIVSRPTVDGAVVYYTDERGVDWISEYGTQSGSTFTITELSDNPNGRSKKIFKATFSCTLYDGNGNSLQVTNAVVRGQILP